MIATVLALGFLTLARTPAAAPAPSPRVLVRVDTVSATKRVRLEEVVRGVTAIWKPYAEVTFADAGDLTRGGYDDELHLVVSDRSQFDASGAPALGWISFVRQGQPLNVITVSVGSARLLMARGGWGGQRFDQLPPSIQQELIARTVSWSVAHEIGHYLLGTSTHAEHGLMRAALTAGDVIRQDRRQTRLEPRDIELLRARTSLDAVLADADAPAPRSE